MEWNTSDEQRNRSDWPSTNSCRTLSRDWCDKVSWVFPKIVVPPNHPFVHRVFHYKPSILGYPYFWKYPSGVPVVAICSQILPFDCHTLDMIKKICHETGATKWVVWSFILGVDWILVPYGALTWASCMENKLSHPKNRGPRRVKMWVMSYLLWVHDARSPPPSVWSPLRQ